MPTSAKPDWVLIANTTRARVLQQEPGGVMVVLESFLHPAGHGRRAEPKDSAGFAHELARYLEHEARLGHFDALALFAPGSFLNELQSALGNATRRLLSSTHEADLTGASVAEVELRVSRELSLAAG